MESRIPVPTDNIFKFYALFGLLLFVFGIGASLYTTKSTNEFMAGSLVELETLEAVVNPSAGQAARKQVLHRLVDVARSDKQTFRWGIGVVVVAGFWMMVFGFHVWHTKVQPLQDEIAILQLRKLRREIALLERGGPRFGRKTNA